MCEQSPTFARTEEDHEFISTSNISISKDFLDNVQKQIHEDICPK